MFMSMNSKENWANCGATKPFRNAKKRTSGRTSQRKKSDEQRITTKRDACSVLFYTGYYINSVELCWGLNRVVPEQRQRKEQYLRFDMVRHMLDFRAYECEHIFKNNIKGEIRSLSL